MRRIVIVGAGSASFGRGMIVDLLRSQELSGRDLGLWLVDVDADALSKMAGFAERVKAHVGSDLEIAATTGNPTRAMDCTRGVRTNSAAISPETATMSAIDQYVVPSR